MDGSWSSWSGWGECSQTCGEGWRKRNRKCSPPLHGGQPCSGEAFEIDGCRISGCSGKDNKKKRPVVECAEVIEEVCKELCMEKKCETTYINSCKTVTKTGECRVRWEDKCYELPHAVQTGVTMKEVTKTVCKKHGQKTTVCPPPSLASCSKESSVSECWTPDTFDSGCQGTLCCFTGCADVCLPSTEGLNCYDVKEIVEEPKTEIVMKEVCMQVTVEDCTQQVEECENIPVEKCSEVAISNNNQVLQDPVSICPKGANKMHRIALVCEMMTRVVCE